MMPQPVSCRVKVTGASDQRYHNQPSSDYIADTAFFLYQILDGTGLGSTVRAEVYGANLSDELGLQVCGPLTSDLVQTVPRPPASHFPHSGSDPGRSSTPHRL